ncbi:methionine--tRNA ligase [Candidatus Kaiserbacteria bacterium]|nr:methionine--tRNA ligase [Candidatus Kaiserbacteria bacterium]
MSDKTLHPDTNFSVAGSQENLRAKHNGKASVRAKYITTTLPYVNASPHMGHALEFVQADTLARYYRLMGHEVFFNTGADEHGQKVAKKADESGIDRQAYADKYAGEFDNLKTAFNLSWDNFIRTTNQQHQVAAQHIWKLCDENGDIYKKQYQGLYCEGCESFKVESDLVDGKCPDHGVAPEEIAEENYFFKLSKYQDYLIKYLSQTGVIIPEFRRQEALKFVEGGLEDLSISREKSRMDWGVPVPGDDNHVMYVWFDALTNYISTLGWPEDLDGKFQKFWVDGDTLQLAGKDQVRFQAIIWQAMLKSAGVVGTDQLFIHGFINSDGQKMSKSIGNVINPYKIVEKYGTDAARYIMLRHVHPTDDSDITWDKMDEWYTANLVNGLGNLTSRVMKMAETHLDAPVSITDLPPANMSAIDEYDFMSAMDMIWGAVQKQDEKITETEPFKLVKEDKPAAIEIIKALVKEVYLIAHHLEPFMPDTSTKIKEAVLQNKKPENLFARLA